MILKTIDLFSGVGGMSYGFEMAGFKSLLAIEKEPNIAKTYQINFPHSKVLNEDVTNLKIHEVLRIW
jgi:site-specific DNA-cytosine methylase